MATKALVNALLADGVRLCKEELLTLWTLRDAITKVMQETLFLELGNDDAGWLHILQEHEKDYEKFDINYGRRLLAL